MRFLIGIQAAMLYAVFLAAVHAALRGARSNHSHASSRSVVPGHRRGRHGCRNRGASRWGGGPETFQTAECFAEGVQAPSRSATSLSAAPARSEAPDPTEDDRALRAYVFGSEEDFFTEGGDDGPPPVNVNAGPAPYEGFASF
jgi:hypothetical protein